MRTRNKLLTTAMALVVPLCTWAQTESEPNDNIATANTITLGTAMNGDMGGFTCVSGQSDDYFVLNLTADGQFNINTVAENLSNGNSNLRVDLYNSVGAQLTWFNHVAGPQGAPNSATTTVNCLNKGIYYLRLHGADVNACYTYALTLTLTAPLFADDAEPNNNLAEADANGTLAPATITEGHVNFSHYVDNSDHYRIESPGDGTLNITLNSEAVGAGSLRVDVYNDAGAQLHWDNFAVGTGGTPNSVTKSYTCDAQGVYYLEVHSTGVCGGSYQLSYTITSPVFANDTEPNNSLAEADANGVLAPATITEGHVNFSHYVDNSDHYRIETPGDGTLNITLNSEAAAVGSLRIDVYNDAGAQLHWDNYAVGTGGAPNSVTKSYSCDAQGVYYLEVHSTGVCGASYELSYTVTPPVFDNDTEPNNTTAQADANPVLAPATVTEGHLNFSHYGDNSDHYRIETPGDGTLNITLNSEAAAVGSLRIDVYNDAGAQLHWDNYAVGTGGAPNSVTKSYSCDAQGVYYLEVHSNGVCGASYELSYTVTPPVFGNDAEPNGTTATAIPFNPDSAQAEGHLNFSHYVENSDHYKVILPVAGDITFDLEAEAATAGTLRINLLNSGGSQIDWDTYTIGGGGVPASSLVNFTGLAAGIYYLNIYVTSGCGTSYRLHCNDADDDGVCNYFDLCPGTPNGEGVNGDGCSCSQISWDDGDVCTLDECTDGSVTHTFQDADGDLICDANDNCPNLSGEQGDPCDDGQTNTGNDMIDANCNCVGQLIDCLGVPGGPALPGTACDDGNPNSANDTWDANCNCVGTLPDDCLGVPGGPAQPGTPCDDGQANTGNDTWDANCVCVGQVIDCLGVPGGPALPGTSCDDGQANTGNDTWDANCTCVGQVIDCLGVPGGPALPGTSCDDGNPNSANDTWDANCNCVGTLANDCLGVPGGPAQPGTPCDDGQANTGNDTWDANCVCVGQVIDCLGVPGGPALPGTSCDDGQANTGNDTWDANCVCVGQVIDCLGVPGGPALPGTSCDDGQANTGNDTWDANCTCVGQVIDCLGVPGGPALPGTACDDGNPNSANDTWDANCNCVGTLADDCLGVPGGPAQPGTPCDDGDACTTGDVYDANCGCAGTFADADGDGTCDADDLCPGSPEPGQACDDGNPLTINDVVDANCTCEGTPIGGCTEILTLDITLDDNGSQTTWEIRDETGSTVILSGGPYQDGLAGTTVSETLCLNQLCYRLVVNDAGGDGISGGYVLRDANNRRIVDANGAFTSTSSVQNEFCLPLSAARLIHSFCDRTDLLYKTSTQIYASFYPGASGYQFWIFDPHGSYSRRVFSASQNLVPANLVTDPVPADMDLNVRVRALVGGNYTAFGAACRFRLNTPGGGGREAILFDEAGNMTMSVYPNPNRGEVVNVAFDGIAAAERMDIEVLDIFGKRVSAQQIAAPGGAFVHTMDLSALAPGVYLVNVRVNDRFHTQRLVRQ